MHKYRSLARSQAWYQLEGEPTNYNPFARHRPQRTTLATEDEENAYRTRTNQSDNQVPTSIELNRRSQNRDFLGPPHSSSMPAQPKRGPFPAMNDEIEDPAQTEKSQDSGTATSNTVIPEDEAIILNNKPEEEEVAKKRTFGGVLNRFHRKKVQDNSMERTTTGQSKRPKQTFTFVGQLKSTLFNSPINILLIMVPVGIGVHFTNIDPIGIFVINFIAIIPLAAMLSYATEELALRTGETLGGLLNATFGNAVELIVSIIALAQKKVDIVQESLIGSMLSNLLLVMGMCFFFGGLNRIKQHFNITVAQTASSLLALAIASLVIPAAFEAWAAGDDAVEESNVTRLSQGTAVLLLLTYAAYLIFQLRTHATMYNAPSPKGVKRNPKVGAGDANRGIAQMGAGISAAMGGANAQETPMREPEEEKEQPQLSLFTALLTLGISTALVGICAEFMTDAIDPITKPCGPLPRTFVGLILLPIVGNAAEHATAVTVAIKDKMDLAIGVAVGSSMQIALLVIPFVVILGWIMGTHNPDMNLAFDPFQIILLFVSILLVNYLIQDGESHWLEGVLLLVLYFIIAVAAWYYPPDPKQPVPKCPGA
ncbi:MAG: hypothetical protein L6R41_005792 [Letrouitia leprolyta]|nr:MAG: hypothetical protein L6R41_005792 [Letrouitia leprolyta]